MAPSQRHYPNNNGKISNSSENDKSESKVLSMAETLYVSLMCLVASCLSSVTFEVGARSPLGHSMTKSATFNALFRRNYNMIIQIPMGNFVSSLISTIILSIGEKYRIPYLYFPWLVNTLKGMIFNEGPALFSLSYNQLPYAIIPASTFGIMTILLFAEEFCLWCDVFSSFKRCWIEYRNYRETLKNKKEKNIASMMMNDEADGYERKIYRNIIEKSTIKTKNIKPDNRRLFRPVPNKLLSLSSSRRAKSLIAINYSHERSPTHI